MGQEIENIAYIVSPNDKLAFSSKRIGVNFVPNGECTNRCIFCAPNIPAMKKLVHGEVLIKQEYSVNEMVQAVSKAYEENPDCSEVIVTGTIGEPLLYLDKLIQFIPQIKQTANLPVRLNTNGQATIIHPKYSSQKICERLKDAGLDSVVISLNAINERNYNIVCRPEQHNSFDSVLDFIKASNKSGIETFVSFVDYPKTHEEFPHLNEKEIGDFCKTLGLFESQIIYRPIIE